MDRPCLAYPVLAGLFPCFSNHESCCPSHPEDGGNEKEEDLSRDKSQSKILFGGKKKVDLIPMWLPNLSWCRLTSVSNIQPMKAAPSFHVREAASQTKTLRTRPIWQPLEAVQSRVTPPRSHCGRFQLCKGTPSGTLCPPIGSLVHCPVGHAAELQPG